MLSAEGRMSAWVLCLLPFALAFAIHILNPKFLSILGTDPTGIKLVIGALVLMAFGILWIRHIIRIHV